MGGLMAYALNWWEEKCNDPNVGYSQSYRYEQTVDGITYYDCSSFVWYGLKHSGFDMTGSAFTTFDMGGILKSLGFKEYIITDFVNFKFQVGDILVINSSSHQHTEIVHDLDNGGHTMGAHGRTGRALPDQVSINSYTIQQGTHYTHCYRWPYSGGEWSIGNNTEYFGDHEKPLCGNDPRAINNGTLIYKYFKSQGWSAKAIAGLLGNIQEESVFNPALIEHGGTGHGFVQWTPPTDLYHVMDVLYGGHDDWSNPQKQLGVIMAEFQQSSGIKNWGIEGQWIPTSAYPMSWREWSRMTTEAGELAIAFEKNYERPAASHPERAEYARAWYQFLLTLEKSDS